MRKGSMDLGSVVEDTIDISSLTDVPFRERAYVELFCRKFNIGLVKYEVDVFDTRRERHYFFTDKTWGYTLQGIIRSLEDYYGNELRKENCR